MAEQKIAGETIIEDEVVASIVGIAAMEVEGVAHLGKASIRRSLTERLAGTGAKARTGVEVEVGKKEAIVDVALGVIYGFNIPNLATEVRKKVASRLLDITGLVAKEINVDVASIEVPAKMVEKVGKQRPKVE